MLTTVKSLDFGEYEISGNIYIYIHIPDKLLVCGVLIDYLAVPHPKKLCTDVLAVH